MTFQELAMKNGISANAIKKRVKKLVAMGVIEYFNVELSLAQVDAEFLLSLVYTNGSEDEKAFIDQIASILYPMVNYIGAASGGIYIIFASYTEGSRGLSKVGSFLRSLESVKDVEVHPLLYNLGKKVEFSKTDLMVLQQLVEDPRIAVSDISKNTGLTARRVSKIIKNLITGEAVQFNLHWNWNAGDSIAFMIRIEFDEKESNLNIVLSILNRGFPDEYLLPIISATSPIVFSMFVVSNLKAVSEITQELRRKMPFITSAVTIIGKPSRSFPDIKKIKLQELIAEAEL